MIPDRWRTWKPIMKLIRGSKKYIGLVWGLRRGDFATVHYFDEQGKSLCFRPNGDHYTLSVPRPQWDPGTVERPSRHTCPDCLQLLQTYEPLLPGPNREAAEA